MAEVEPKKSFILYTDIREALSQLDDATRGNLFLHIFDYVESGIVPDMEPLEKMAFTFIKNQIDRDFTKYQNICEKRKLAGSKGGKAKAEKQAKQANAKFAKQNQANQADNDSDNENENDSENDSDKKYICAEPLQDSPPEPEEPPVISFILNDKSRYSIKQAQVDEWSGLYPAVDVMQELRKMAGWLDANPNKRKTARGILRFVNGWLAREQDKGGSKKQVASPEQETSFDLDEYERSTGLGCFVKGKNTTAQQSYSSDIDPNYDPPPGVDPTWDYYKQRGGYDIPTSHPETKKRLEGQDENGFRVYEV